MPNMVLTIDPFALLIYILIVLAIIALAFLIAILFRVHRIVKRVERISAYADQFGRVLSAWEKMPSLILGRIFEKFFGDKR